LLKYYDKHYLKALNNRPDLESVMYSIQLADVSAEINTTELIKRAYEPAD
jgi:hypothetical protein